MKRRLTALWILAAAILMCCGYLAITWILDNKPNKQIIASEELFGVSGDELAIYVDGELQEAHGISRGGRAFLPYEWVIGELNPTFYVDETQRLILYTMPGGTVCYGEDDLLIEDGAAYLSLEAVNLHTDMAAQTYLGSSAQRIFIWTKPSSYETLEVTESTRLHAGDSIKTMTVRELEAGEVLRVLDDPYAGADRLPARAMARVQTQDGYAGWVLRRCLYAAAQTVTYVSTYEEPVYSHIAMPGKVCLAWHQVDNKSMNDSIASLLAQTEGVNVVSPTWFSLRGNAGEFNSLADKGYVDRLHAMGIQVWGLVDNFDDSVRSAVLLSDMTAREKLVDGLIEAAQEYGLDGINIDFERMPREASLHFAQFIRELSVEAHRHGLIISVDNPNTQSYNLYYRRDVQGAFADYVINMGYDEHYAGGEAGSVASYPFVYEGIMSALDEVPADRLIGGVPFYTRIWTLTGSGTTSKAVGLDAAAQWVSDNGVKLTWDDDIGQYCGSCTTSDGECRIWLEDAKSLRCKMQLFKEQDLAGVAVWRLGLSTADGWQAIAW